MCRHARSSSSSNNSNSNNNNPTGNSPSTSTPDHMDDVLGIGSLDFSEVKDLTETWDNWINLEPPSLITPSAATTTTSAFRASSRTRQAGKLRLQVPKRNTLPYLFIHPIYPAI